MDPEGLKRATVSSLLWKLFEKGGRALVELAVQIALARLLAPEQFGVLAIMLVFVNVGNVIVQSGLNTALVQSPDVSDDDCSTVYWISSFISALLYLAIFLTAPLIAGFYESYDIVWPLRVLSLILVINAYNAVQVAIVQRRLQFRKVFNATVVAVVVSGVLGVGLALAGAGLWALVAQQLIYQICNCIVMAVQVRWRPSFVFDLARAGQLFSFGWKLLVSGLLDQGYQSLSDLIIGKQFNSANLGLVSQGKRYPAALGSMLDGAIQPVMLSAVSRVQGDLLYVKRLVRRALKTSTFLIVPSMTLLAVVAKPVVVMLLGERWLPCVPFFQMYCVSYMLLPIHTTNLQALNGLGRSDLFLKLEIVKKSYGLVFLLFTAFVLKDVYFMVGSYIVTGVISTFVNAWPNRSTINYSYREQLRDISPSFLLSFVAGFFAGCVSLLGFSDAATVVVQCFVMLASYLGMAKLFKVEEFDYLTSMAKRAIASMSGAL